MADDLHAGAFAPHQGSTFTTCFEGAEPVPLTLIEVNELPFRERAPRADPFSLVFTGPSTVQFQQGVYPLEHEALGRLEVFLVPIQPDADGLPRLEAVFN
jgi:hypothetical protein